MGSPGEVFGTILGHAKFGPNFEPNLEPFLKGSSVASAGCAKPLRHSLGGTDRVWRARFSTPAPRRGGGRIEPAEPGAPPTPPCLLGRLRLHVGDLVNPFDHCFFYTQRQRITQARLRAHGGNLVSLFAHYVCEVVRTPLKSLFFVSILLTFFCTKNTKR